MIAQQVTAELAQHKGARDARKRDRARRAIRELEEYEQSSAIPGRPGVTVAFGQKPPSKAFMAEHNLEWDEGDDHILASMLLAKEANAEVRIVLVSDDVNHRQRAKGLGLEAVGLPEDYEQPSEPDPSEAKIRQLEQRNRELEDQQPILSLAVDKRGVQDIEIPPPINLDPKQIASDYVAEIYRAEQNAQKEHYHFVQNSRQYAEQYRQFFLAFNTWADRQSAQEAMFRRTVWVPSLL